MTKKQHYMTEHERYKLESYLEAGRSVSWIARKLGFCRQTIYNEMKRGKYLHTVRWWDEVRYSADKGQQVHKYNQTAKGRPLKIGADRAYADFLERKMLGVQENGKVDRRKRYSPAVALELARREGFETSVCVGTLYNYIDKRVFTKPVQQGPLGEGAGEAEEREGTAVASSSAAVHRGQTRDYQPARGAGPQGD